MIAKCTKLGMKPVCEHPSYCKKDAKSLYLGQSGHLSYPAHRNSNKLTGHMASIRDNWKGVCNYAAKVNGGGNALCNIPINSHSWQGTGRDAGFICGAEHATTFTGTLGSRKGIAGRKYAFRVTLLTSKSGKYADNMIKRCASYGMKPICDHYNYCVNDKNALYLGQEHHLGYPPHRNSNKYTPGGFASVRAQWTGLCSYAAKAQGKYGNALCNKPTNTHSWQVAPPPNMMSTI